MLLTLLHDIGDRKRAEKEVEEGLDRVAQMAKFPDMNPGPVVCVTLEGTVEMANQAARRLFGEQTLQGSSLWNLIPAIDPETRARVMAESDPIQLDAQVGQTWLRLTLTPDRESDQIFVYGTDISQQRAAEQDIAERARFPFLNPGPVARLDRSGTVLRANPAAVRIFARESLTGISWRELCPSLADSVWDRVFEVGANVTHEEDIGEQCFSFALRHEPQLDQVFVYGSDVTEMKMAERSLAELARFPDMNPGPVCRLDRSGKILLANPAALAVFGADDLSGQSWLELCPGVDEQVWRRILASSSAVPIETRIGGRHYVMTHAPGPEELFVFVYGSDISEQKQAETALRQSEKMATLGTLTAGMAHELNNPAAAAQRAAAQLEATFDRLQRIQLALRSVPLPAEGDSLLKELQVRAREPQDGAPTIGQLERSDLEAELEDWLYEEGVDEPWEIAAGLVELGYDRSEVSRLAQRTGGKNTGIISAWQSQVARVYRLLE